MMKFLPLLALPLVPLLYQGGAAATAHTVAAAGQATRCEIRAVDTAGGVHLEAVVNKGAAVDGDYRFEVESQSQGGTSQTAQSGTFSVEGGEEALLGQVTIAASNGASYAAALTLEVGGEEVSCRAGR